jgi:tRNA threonylcarbamoyladenosine biosynthesis protein TsaB
LTCILAIDSSSAWCSVALGIDDQEPLLLHEKLSAGASQHLLPWIENLLKKAQIDLQSLDAIAVGVGPGAFTGVRLGVAVVQGLAIAANLPVLPIVSLDGIAAQLVQKPQFSAAKPSRFMVAVDARMDEVYWAHYQITALGLPVRLGDVSVSSPDDVPLDGIQFIAGNAIREFGNRLLSHSGQPFSADQLDADIGISAIGILTCGQISWAKGLAQDIHLLEPLYVRNKVAFTAQERKQVAH